MDQPVQIGLTFPRSGQQLFVTVSARSAETVQSQYTEYNAPRVNANAASRLTRSSSDSDTHH